MSPWSGVAGSDTSEVTVIALSTRQATRPSLARPPAGRETNILSSADWPSPLQQQTGALATVYFRAWWNTCFPLERKYLTQAYKLPKSQIIGWFCSLIRTLKKRIKARALGYEHWKAACCFLEIYSPVYKNGLGPNNITISTNNDTLKISTTTLLVLYIQSTNLTMLHRYCIIMWWPEIYITTKGYPLLKNYVINIHFFARWKIRGKTFGVIRVTWVTVTVRPVIPGHVLFGP